MGPCRADARWGLTSVLVQAFETGWYARQEQENRKVVHKTTKDGLKCPLRLLGLKGIQDKLAWLSENKLPISNP